MPASQGQKVGCANSENNCGKSTLLAPRLKTMESRCLPSELANNAQTHCRAQINNQYWKSVAKNENLKSQRILSDATSALIGIQFPNRWHISERKWLHPRDRKWVTQIVRTIAAKTHYAHVSRLWRVDDCRSELANNAQMHCRAQINNQYWKSVAKNENLKSRRILSDATSTLLIVQC